MENIFGKWWSEHKHQTRQERYNHFESLSKKEQHNLKKSFLKDGWCQLFCQNRVDRILDRIKYTYNIDLIDLRIKSIKYGRIFILDKEMWENIKNMIFDYDPLYNSDLIFGGITSSPWGKHNHLVIIKAEHR